MDGHSHPAQPGRSLDEIEAEITELAGHLNAAQHRWQRALLNLPRWS